MTSEQLITHFDRISEAPSAIPRMRQFILELAVRGKLVEQRSCEQLEVTSLTAGAFQLQGTAPFQIPSSWAWTSVAALADTRLGKMLDKGKNKGTFRRYLRNVNVRWFDFDLSDVLEMRFEDSELEEFALHTGDVLICEGGEPGRCAVWDGREKNIYFQKAIHRLRFPKGVSPRYFAYVLRESANSTRLSAYFTGVGIKHLTGKGLGEFLIPLPPLAEQERIVAKINELMALCEELQTAQLERETRRDALVAASLHHLTNGTDSHAFREHAAFYFNHLPRLTVRAEHIEHLRNAALTLAVRGRLVHQDPSDEPASELLKRIQHCKRDLTEGDSTPGREKPVSELNLEDQPYTAPSAWQWVRLGTVTQLITKGSSPRWQGVEYVTKDNGILFVTSENVGNYRLTKMHAPKYVERRFNEIEPRSILKSGDILMNLVGASIGRTAVYDLHERANINQAVALIRLVDRESDFCPQYLLYYFNSPIAIKMMLASRVVTAQPNMSLTDAREFPVPIPPLAEQYRIVAKLNELSELFERLESEIEITQAGYHELLEALLHETLEKLATPEPMKDDKCQLAC